MVNVETPRRNYPSHPVGAFSSLNCYSPPNELSFWQRIWKTTKRWDYIFANPRHFFWLACYEIINGKMKANKNINSAFTIEFVEYFFKKRYQCIWYGIKKYLIKINNQKELRIIDTIKGFTYTYTCIYTYIQLYTYTYIHYTYISLYIYIYIYIYLR